MNVRPLLDPIWRAFALPATVIVPGAAALETSGVWITPQTFEVPDGSIRKAESRRTLAFRRDEVADVPRDSRVRVAETTGGAIVEWRVDGYALIDAEVIEVLLVRGP